MKDISDHFKPKSIIPKLSDGLNFLKAGLKIKMDKEITKTVSLGKQAKTQLNKSK